jgi:cold shock CspA family protein
MPSGVVQWYDGVRGVGLIRREGDGADVSAERLAVLDNERPLTAGERVMFNTALDVDGLRADKHSPSRSA